MSSDDRIVRLGDIRRTRWIGPANRQHDYFYIVFKHDMGRPIDRPGFYIRTLASLTAYDRPGWVGLCDAADLASDQLIARDPDAK